HHLQSHLRRAAGVYKDGQTCQRNPPTTFHHFEEVPAGFVGSPQISHGLKVAQRFSGCRGTAIGVNLHEVLSVRNEPEREEGRDAERVHEDHQAGVHLHRRVGVSRADQAVVRPQVLHSVVERLTNEGLEYVK
ncbi:unnamed protein product, partial [Ectocarpus sp. 8 AP-2014]